jgi:hypothetical protein
LPSGTSATEREALLEGTKGRQGDDQPAHHNEEDKDCKGRHSDAHDAGERASTVSLNAL